MIAHTGGNVNHYFASYAKSVGWVAKTWPSQLPAHAFGRTFHTKAPANKSPMGGARSAEKNFILLGKCIAGSLAGVHAFVRSFARDAQNMASPLATSHSLPTVMGHLFG